MLERDPRPPPHPQTHIGAHALSHGLLRMRLRAVVFGGAHAAREHLRSGEVVDVRRGVARVAVVAFALERGVDALVCAAEALEGCEDDRTPAAALLEAIAIAKAQRLESAEKALGAGGGSGGGDVALTLRPARVVEVAWFA